MPCVHLQCCCGCTAIHATRFPARPALPFLQCFVAAHKHAWSARCRAAPPSTPHASQSAGSRVPSTWRSTPTRQAQHNTVRKQSGQARAVWSGCRTPACRSARMPGHWPYVLPLPSLRPHAAVPRGSGGGCLRALQGGACAAGMAGRHRRLPAPAREPAAAPQRHRPAANVRLGQQSHLYPNSSSSLRPPTACCAVRRSPICCAAACSGHPHSIFCPHSSPKQTNELSNALCPLLPFVVRSAALACT